MRLLRGSGIAGLSAMADVTERDGLALARPLLDVPKSQLIATLKRAGIDFADDPTNRDTAFTRVRLRALLPALAAEGGNARNLARLAARLARANAAVELMADGAERFLALREGAAVARGAAARSFEAAAFAGLPDEVRLRLLMRAINAVGHEGPAELGKVETLLAELDRSIARPASAAAVGRHSLRQTLAGALISLSKGRIHIHPAPVRRAKGR
jgi:tRNA(Ile)-lysidine synthase